MTTCEPPEGLRLIDGWHWVEADRPIICQWRWGEGDGTGRWKMPGSNIYDPRHAFARGYRYIAPVVPPDVMGAVLHALNVAVNEQSPANPAWSAIHAALARYAPAKPTSTPG